MPDLPDATCCDKMALLIWLDRFFSYRVRIDFTDPILSFSSCQPNWSVPTTAASRLALPRNANHNNELLYEIGCITSRLAFRSITCGIHGFGFAVVLLSCPVLCLIVHPSLAHTHQISRKEVRP